MSAEMVLDRAADLGITLTVKGDRIRYCPKSVAPADFVEELRRHKPEIMEQLRQQKWAPPSHRYDDSDIETIRWSQSPS